MKLYYFPLSTYSQKTLMALYEMNAAFDRVVVNLGDPVARAEYEKVNPLGRVPFLHLDEDNWRIPESSIIIEYADRHCAGGVKLIPDDPDKARQTRFYDRMYDLYVIELADKIFFDSWRPADKRDPFGVEQAHKRLDKFLSLNESNMEKRTWALGDTFTMADCTAAAALTFARRVHPFDERKALTAYLGRLQERPSFQRVIKEAEEFRATASH